MLAFNFFLCFHMQAHKSWNASMKDRSKVAGGIARAEKLSSDERSEIARTAAVARWGLPKASHFGTIAVGNIEIPCFVLEDGRRVISGRGLTTAVGMKGRGPAVSYTHLIRSGVPTLICIVIPLTSDQWMVGESGRRRR